MEERIEKFYNYLTEKKYKDIAVYDVSMEKQQYSYIFITSCTDNTLNKKLAEEIMADFGIQTFPEGFNRGEWIIFDFDDIVMHSFIPTSREKYNLDKLWQTRKIVVNKQSKKNKK